MEKISYAVLTFLLNALWQIALIYLVTSFFARLMRSAPARYVHCLWVLALVVSLVIPLWSLSGFGGDASADAASSVNTEAIDGTPAFIPDVWMKATSGIQLPRLVGEQSNPIPYAPHLTLALMSCYCLLMCRRLWALRRGWKATVEMRRAAFRRELPPLMHATVERCRAAFGVRNFTVLCSTQATSPFTVGFRRPVIVLPESLFDETSGDVLISALGHEMAHLRRRDFPLNIVYTLLCIPVSFHPLASLIKRRISETRELACDEAVVNSARIINASSYARSLVYMAASVSSLSHPGYTLGVFDAGILEERVMKLINQHNRASALFGKALVFAASLALGLTSFAAAKFAFHAVPSELLQGGARAEKSIVGLWQGKFPECVEASCPPALDLAVKADGGKLSGLAIFYMAINDGDGPKVKDKVESPLLDARFDGTTLSFKIKTKSEGLLSFEMKLVADNEGALRNLSVDDSSVFRMLKKEGAGAAFVPFAPNAPKGATDVVNQMDSIAGDWTLRFGVVHRTPLPSTIVSVRSTPGTSNVSSFPFGQRTSSLSGFVAAPRPKKSA